MENKQEKKSNKGLVIILILIILGLGGYLVYDKLIDNNEVKEEKVEEEVSIKIDETKDYVYEADYENTADIVKLEKKLSDDPGFILSRKLDYTGKIPYINISSHDAEKVNSNIKNVIPTFEETQSDEENFGVTYMGYEVYKYKEYISVLFVYYSSYSTIEYPSYTVYTFNTKTGNLVSNDEILNITSLNKDTINEKLKPQVTNFLTGLGYDNEPNHYGDDNFSEGVISANERIIGNIILSNNKTEYTCIGECSDGEGYLYYINDSGNLNIIISVVIPEQETYYPQIFEIK